MDIRNNELATFEQIPLLPAYAITIHKSQGMTLDGAIIKPNNIFGEGMAYVALSRVKDSNNLFTTSRLPLTKINANKTALDFVKKFIK
ncbi:hypothetical protein FACS189459_2970 [Bacilli bacterium]|nr:hypothetical protein FACS189459_2970 [Bacilli bacterium]GHU51702.1 hypothetical protein FACS189496_0460 [Bacilli bacterium]